MARRPRRRHVLGRKGNSRRPLHRVRSTPYEHPTGRRTPRAQERTAMTLARTGGLALDVDEGLRGVLTFGWLEADSVRADALPEGFATERDALLEQLRTRQAGRAAADIPGVAENRAMFHR